MESTTLSSNPETRENVRGKFREATVDLIAGSIGKHHFYKHIFYNTSIN